MPVTIDTYTNVAQALAAEDNITVSEPGMIRTESTAITGLGNGNSLHLDGLVYSVNDTAIVLNAGCDVKIALGVVSGEKDGIRIKAVDAGQIYNTGVIVGKQGSAIIGDGKLKIHNTFRGVNGTGAIEGKVFGVDFANGSGSTNNLVIKNDDRAQIKGAVAIRSTGDSDDYIENSGTISATTGIAVLLGGGNDTYKDLGTGSAIGTIDLGEGDDHYYASASVSDDIIQGGNGTDRAHFGDQWSNYKIVKNANGSFSIASKLTGSSKSDTFYGFERFHFSDGEYTASELLSGKAPPPPPDPKPDPVEPGPVTPGPGGTPGTPAPVEPTPSQSGQVLTGTRAKNTLTGGAGNDKLNGGYGNDILTGGTGQDVFVFDAKLGTSKTDRKVNFDTITDFSVADDTIWLDNKVFKKLGKGSEASPGQLNSKYFKVGKAKDKNDYVLYDKKTGVLSYDADGSGSKYTPVEFAKLAKNLSLSAADFCVV